jgi:hypothetical protein
MLKTIISLPGKTGLFRLISQSKKLIIVESIADQRRIPVYVSERAASLGEISIYTEQDNVPLSQVLQTIVEKQNGAPVVLESDPKAAETLKTWFAEILPEFDRQRVHVSDIKKIITWYNFLVEHGWTKFDDESPENTDDAENASPEK